MDNIALIILLPLWIFLIIMCGRFLSVYINKFIIYGLTLLSSFLGIILSITALSTINNSIEWTIPFIQINNFIIPFGIRADKISLIVAFVLYTVSFLVQIFSVSYMKEEKQNYRFFALLNLFNFAMGFLLFSPNLFQMYVFWELVGIVSYLLIGFDYKREEKSNASRRVFLMNRVGDTALIGGIVLSSYFMYSYVADKSLAGLSFTNFNDISILLSVYTSAPEFYIITGLFLLASIVKSAQFPFYTWLQDAMEAEIPVSALLHSATMVVAGIYLAIRMLPIFTLNSQIMNFLAFIGIITAIVCSILASVETHPKKILAYSTSANLGLMFLAVGLENIKAAIIFLIAHAFIKSMLFLQLPNKKNQISYAGLGIFVLGALSLSGLLFAGLSSKEYIYTGINNSTICVLFILISFLTAFYISRLSFIIFKNSERIRKPDLTEFLSVLSLLILNIIFYIKLRSSIQYSISAPFFAGLSGVFIAFIQFRFNLLCKFNSTPKILEKLYNVIIPKLYENFSIICRFIDENLFSNYKPILKISSLSVKCADWIETNVMNKTVSATTCLFKELSKLDSIIQTRNIQNYNAYAFIIITGIISLVIIAYTVIFGQIS